MSADNYAECPTCLDGASAEPTNSLREEWDIGMSPEGVLNIEYTGKCTVCGLYVELKQTHTVYTPRKDRT